MNAQRKKAVQRRATQKKAQETVVAPDTDTQNTENSEVENVEQTTETAAPVEAVATPLPTSRETRTKRRRRDMRGGSVLRAPLWAEDMAKENNWVLRYINDPAGSGQRLSDREEMGWNRLYAPADKERSPGTVSADEAGPDSTLVSRSVDNRTGMKAYLCYMPKDEYDGYQQDKLDRNKKAEDAQNRGGDVANVEGITPYGSIETNRIHR